MENNTSVVVLSVTVIVIVFSYVLYKQMGSEKTSTDSTNDKKTEKAGSKSDVKKDAPNVRDHFLLPVTFALSNFAESCSEISCWKGDHLLWIPDRHCGGFCTNSYGGRKSCW